MGLRFFVFTLVMLYLVAGPPPAMAASSAGAGDDLIRQGVERRRHGDDAGALHLFEQAYDKGHSPRALAQMALAEQALGKWVVADEHLRQALAIRGDAWITKNHGPLTEAAARVGEHIGRIEILGGSAGAEVRIDGGARGTLPLARPIAAPTGSVTIDIVMPGRLGLRRTTNVRAGETTRESFDTLAPAGANAASFSPDREQRPILKTTGARASIGGAGAIALAGPGDSSQSAEDESAVRPPDKSSDKSSAPDDSEPPAARGSRARLPLVLGAAGLSAAALAFAIVEHVSWSSKVNSFNEMDACDPRRDNRGGPTCAALYDDGHRARNLAFISYGVAGALAATSAVLFFSMDTGPPPADHRVACSIDAAHPAQPGLACVFRF